MVKKTSNSLKVDFTGVETGGSFAIPDGMYVLSVTSVEQKKSAESGNAYLAWEYKIDEGKHKGKKVWDNTSLQPQALWKLRGLLECMGMDVADGEFEIDLSDFDGQIVGAEIANEKYQGKDKPRVVAYIPPEDAEEGEVEEEEETPPPKETKSTKKKPEPEPEPEAEEEEEEEEEEVGEEKKPEPPKTTRKKKTAAPEFEVGMAVTFEDEGESFKGKIHSIGEDTVEVKVGKDVWELGKDEVTPA